MMSLAMILPAAWHGRDLRLAAAFYLAIPACTALFLGANHAGVSTGMSLVPAVLYWAGITVPFFWLLDGLSRIIDQWAVRRGSSVITSLVLASVAAMIVFAPFVSGYSRLAAQYLAPNTPFEPPRTMLSAFDGIGDLMAFSVVPLYWVSVVYLASRSFNFSLYRDAFEERTEERFGPANDQPPLSPPTVQTPAEDGLAPPPSHASQLERCRRDLRDAALRREGLFGLLPHDIGVDVQSLHAEDHYVRVHTALGQALIRYRFKKAVSEVAALEGAQVHRSHWVRTDMIEGVVDDGSQQKSLRLRSGETVPVSRSNLGVLRAIGIE